MAIAPHLHVVTPVPQAALSNRPVDLLVRRSPRHLPFFRPIRAAQLNGQEGHLPKSCNEQKREVRPELSAADTGDVLPIAQ